MIHDLEVDAAGMRQCASGLAHTADRVGSGVRVAPEPVAGPRWVTTDAASLVADAARRSVTSIGEQIGSTARQIVAALVDYEDADDRAAGRLRGVR